MNGDTIYNGAVDNATGCAMLLEMARLWAALDQKPRRSALFLAVTAEEGGLRGSEYYAAHPIVPPGKTAVALNFDAILPFGRTKDVVLIGAQRTTFWPQVQEAAQRMSLVISPTRGPSRAATTVRTTSPLPRPAIPAFSVEQGEEFAGKPAGFGEKAFEEFNEKHYHQPSDEYRDDWDLSGMEQIARFGFLLGQTAANLEKLPTWNAGDEFLAAREKAA